jgi:hypothetical protein
MTLSAALLEHWVFGAFLCKLVNFTPTLTALVSTFTVAIIAVERWFFIVNKQKFDRRCTLLTLILLWIVSILIALPEFISRRIQEFAPPPMSFSMMKMEAFLNTVNNNNTDFSMMDSMKPPCHMKKIHFCVLNPGLRMRIFSYIVITVQYLVPFLFVSVSCYSISRFLKRRMKQMRTYQIHRPTNTTTNNRSKKPQVQRKKSNLDETTEHELTSYEELPVTTVTNENKSNDFLTRICNLFQNREQYQTSIVLERQSYRSSSIVGTVLMPTVKSQTHSERRFHRSKKLLICVAALFTISWLPLTVIQIYLEHNEGTSYTRDGANFVYGYLLIPCYLISSLSAWINPVIYNYINRSFRREFYALYSCCFNVSSSSSTSRKELTSIAPKKHRRETTHVEEIHTTSSPRSTIKQGTHVVCFADEATIMFHKQS